MNLIRYKQIFLAMLPVMLLLSTVPSQAYTASNRDDKQIDESAEGTVSPTADLITAKLGSQFQLKLNHTAIIEPTSIKVKFVKVTQDTRCPTGAQCVSEGQASILVSIMKNDKKIIDQELTLNPEYLAFKAFDKYSIRFVKLEPYPSRGELIRTSDYTATMIVEQVRPDQSPDRVFLKGTGEFRILAAWSYEEMKGVIIAFQQNAGRYVLHLKLTFADCVHFRDSDDCIVTSTYIDHDLILMPIRLEIDKNNMKLFFQTLDKSGEEYLFDIEKIKKWPMNTVSEERFKVTKEDAIKIVKDWVVANENREPLGDVVTSFAFLKYNGTIKGNPYFIWYQADPNSTAVGEQGRNVVFDDSPYGKYLLNKYLSNNKVDRFAWVVYFFEAPPPSSSRHYFVDANSGEIIGYWTPCPECVCHHGNETK